MKRPKLRLRALVASDITTFLIYSRLAECFQLTPPFITPYLEQCDAIKALKKLKGAELENAVAALSIDKMTTRYKTIEDVSNAFHSLSDAAKMLILSSAISAMKITNDELHELIRLHVYDDGKPMATAEIRALDIETAFSMALESLVHLSETKIDLGLLQKAEMEILDLDRVVINDEMADIAATSHNMPLNQAVSLAVKRSLKKWLIPK